MESRLIFLHYETFVITYVGTYRDNGDTQWIVSRYLTSVW